MLLLLSIGFLKTTGAFADNDWIKISQIDFGEFSLNLILRSVPIYS